MDESIFKADISILIMFIMLADKCLFKRWEEEISLKIFVLSEDFLKAKPNTTAQANIPI